MGGRGRIGEFRYTPLIGPDILSGILVKVTGQPVFDFAAENLFGPLGITVERNLLFHNAKEQQEFNKATDISGWATDTAGINAICPMGICGGFLRVAMRQWGMVAMSSMSMPRTRW